jgi:hypothetical protein
LKIRVASTSSSSIKDGERRGFALFEQWTDQGALDAHLDRARAFFGDPHSEGGKLPAALLDFFDEIPSETFEFVV